MTLTTLPISSERWARELIFSETVPVAAAILLHGGCRGLHYRAALVGGLGGQAAGAGGAFGVVADFADGRGHLLCRGGDLVGFAGLGIGVSGGLHGACADLGCGRRKGLRTMRDGLDHLADDRDAGVQSLSHPANFVGAGYHNVCGEVFVGELLQHAHHPHNARRDDAVEPNADEGTERNDEQSCAKGLTHVARRLTATESDESSVPSWMFRRTSSLAASTVVVNAARAASEVSKRSASAPLPDTSSRLA